MGSSSTAWRWVNDDSTFFSPNRYAWTRPSGAPIRDGDARNQENWRSGYDDSTFFSPNRRSGSNPDVRVSNYQNRPPRRLPYIPRQSPPPLTQEPWRLFEDRVRTGPYGLNGFPLHPLSPMRVIVLGQEDVNPRLRQFIQESPPRIRGQWNTQLASEEDDESKLTREEQKNAVKKLQKQVYNPYPNNKNKNKRWCLYYRDTNASFSKRDEQQDDDDGDGKSCAICLDDFVPKQEVLVTPCNHMFHEDCIVRWVKSNGQCPVCRFAIGEQRRGAALAALNNNTAAARLPNNDVDLMSLVRAMEEAFEWVQASR